MNQLHALSSDEILDEHERCRLAVEECDAIAASMTLRMEECREEIRRRSRAASLPCVSSHALLRYLERVRGVDLLAIEQEILDEGMVQAIRTGATMVKRGRLRFPISGNVVKTVLRRDGRPGRASRIPGSTRGTTTDSDDLDDRDHTEPVWIPSSGSTRDTKRSIDSTRRLGRRG